MSVIRNRKKKVNEGIINHFLANICKNFSCEGHLVEYRSVLADSNFETNADICFEPINLNDTWTLRIRKKDLIENFEPPVKDWQSGYSILIKAVQTLTYYNDSHSDSLISKFRTMLKHFFIDETVAFEICMRCFTINANQGICSNCSLKFCKKCLTTILCNRCIN